MSGCIIVARHPWGEPGADRIVQDARGVRENLLTLHGNIANTSAHYVAIEVDERGVDTLSVRDTVDDAILFSPKLRLQTTVKKKVGSVWLELWSVVCHHRPLTNNSYRNRRVDDSAAVPSSPQGNPWPLRR